MSKDVPKKTTLYLRRARAKPELDNVPQASRRTLFVARESTSPTKPQDSQLYLTSTDVPRDASGQLVPRAGLGTREDLELYDQFLTSAGRTPMAGHRSPTTMTTTTTTTTTPSTHHQSHKSIPTRAHTHVPFHERLARDREAKILTNWRKHNRAWARFRHKMAKKLGPEHELVITRASE